MSGVPSWCAASRAMATQRRSRSALIPLRYANAATATMIRIMKAKTLTLCVIAEP